MDTGKASEEPMDKSTAQHKGAKPNGRGSIHVSTAIRWLGTKMVWRVGGANYQKKRRSRAEGIVEQKKKEIDKGNQTILSTGGEQYPHFTRKENHPDLTRIGYDSWTQSQEREPEKLYRATPRERSKTGPSVPSAATAKNRPGKSSELPSVQEL